MTSKNIPLRTIVGAGFVAAALVAAACEAPRPEPVAPIPVKPTETVEQLVSENPVRSEEFTRLRAECDASWSKGCSPSVIVIAADGHYSHPPLRPEAGMNSAFSANSLAPTSIAPSDCGSRIAD